MQATRLAWNTLIPVIYIYFHVVPSLCCCSLHSRRYLAMWITCFFPYHICHGHQWGLRISVSIHSKTKRPSRHTLLELRYNYCAERIHWFVCENTNTWRRSKCNLFAASSHRGEEMIHLELSNRLDSIYFSVYINNSCIIYLIYTELDILLLSDWYPITKTMQNVYYEYDDSSLSLSTKNRISRL